MSKPKPTLDPDALVAGLQDLSLGSRKNQQETLDGCPPRPGYGQAGKAINVSANMFMARFKGQGATVNHYDVEMKPVVKTTGQKKPRPLLQKIWNQLVKEAPAGDLKKALDAAAYDQVKSFYTPFGIPMSGDKLEIVIALKEDDNDNGDEEKRRWKIVIKFAQKVDLDTIIDYCEGNRQSEQARAMMLVAIQAMNVLFRQDPASRFAMSGAAGRRFFTEEGGVPLSNGGVLYKGFQQSFRWTSAKFPALQIDTAYSAFVEPGPLPEVAAKLLGLGGGGGGGGRGRGFDRGRGGRGFDRGGSRGGRGGGAVPSTFTGPAPSIQELNLSQIRRLNEILRAAKFKVTHRKSSRVFSLGKITTRSTDQLKFNLRGRDGAQDRSVSVAQYFKETYNVTVTKPRLPCVEYGKGNFVPMEFVRLEPFNSIPMLRITAEQTAEIIKQAAKPPPEREAAINAWRQRLNYSNLPKLKAWGVEVKPSMMSIPARVLNPPNIFYGGSKSIRANFGSWNMKGIKFTKPGRPLKSWSIVSFDQYCGVSDLVCKSVATVPWAHPKHPGCPVENKRPACVQMNPNAGGPSAGIKAGLQEGARQAFIASKLNPQLILVIMPRKDVQMYQQIKSIAVLTAFKPIVTQCLQAQKIKSDRGLDQYCGNVAMKVHSKLGGLTHQVQHQIDKNVMMIGADVSHPPPKHGAIPPSIAVTVCAVNGENNKFVPAIRLQEGRVRVETYSLIAPSALIRSHDPSEIISDLENMIYDHITTFEKNMKTKPQKILFFRDGVSEGQYSHCVELEVATIKKATRRFKGYSPKVTFVICAKRHAMRFFAQNDGDRDRTGNLPPGTIVDSQVTSPMVHDFYLQAHAGLQGTARPTHYVVVADENKLVPVAYYADIVADKVRSWVYSDDSDDSSVAPSTTGSGPRENMTFDPLRLKKRIEADADFNNVAWYM
ncbi:argonaute [Kwoniella heveanensis BCC8398]|uniref:Argonaute n=1 Tax=Kwoniella heveanensis BCC8398 TaxID=1296120 RepID=A0A1B9GP66_9TREE|nr:argonaute [Kwoniella heveanensis BCC8398]